MGDWRMGSQRRGGGYYHNGGGDGYSRRPYWKPPPSGYKQPCVPAWEKDFCFHVGGIPWKKVLAAKELLPIYKNVVLWDDSAAEEAFHNAKSRFWARINNLPCSIPLPDPGMFIDDVDLDCKIDPQLIADLEKRPDPPMGNDSCQIRPGPVVPTGWSDAEEQVDPVSKLPETIGWDDWEGGNDGAPVPTGWDDWEGGNDGVKKSAWDSGPVWGNSRENKTNEQWGSWESHNRRESNEHEWKMDRWKNDADNYYLDSRRNNKRRGGHGGGWYGARNQSPGYKGSWDGYHGGNNSWRNCRGRRRSGHGNDRDQEPQVRWSLPIS